MSRTRLLVLLALGLALQTPAGIPAQEGSPPRLDRFGEPLPVGALARLGTLRFHRCSYAAYSPDGKRIATVDRDEVNLWDVATSRRIRRLPLENLRSVAGLIFSHDGKKLAVIGWGGSPVQVWDLDTFNKVVLSQENGGGGGGDWSSAAAFSSDDRTLVATASTGAVRSGTSLRGRNSTSFPCVSRTCPSLSERSRSRRTARSWPPEATGSCISGTLRQAALLHEVKLLSRGQIHEILQGRQDAGRSRLWPLAEPL